MNNLNLKTQQHEYFRVMEKRIRYYAEKYDPHTIMVQQDAVSNDEILQDNGRKGGFSLLRAIFLNIF